MRRICLFIVMCCLFSCCLHAQTLIEQIEQAYNSLDSTAYINEMVMSYAKYLKKEQEENYQLFLELSGTPDSTGVYHRNERVDRMYSKFLTESEISNVQYLKRFENTLKTSSPTFLLNLKMKDDQTLQVDTGRLAFNLFCFDKKYEGDLYVYCDDGEYSWDDARYRTFSKKFGKNAPKVFRRIMRKHPKYLLYCTEWESMNAIFYLLNNEIYVYRIIEMQEYTLDDYVKAMKARGNRHSHISGSVINMQQ